MSTSTTTTPSSPSNAFITLLTSPSYLPGALVLAHSLTSLHPPPSQRRLTPSTDFKTVCLVTPETVDVGCIKLLRGVFDLVIGVEVIGSGEGGKGGLELMGRPDLHSALTKIHIFRLSHLFSSLIYLDADVLPLRPLSHLFSLPNHFSACPDVGWPDCFNSGVMVLKLDQGRGESDWKGLRGLMGLHNEGEGEGEGMGGEAAGESLESRSGMANQAGGKSEVGGTRGSSGNGSASGNGSFDGADQGLLNEWFSEEGGGGDWNRLSFTYNVTPSAAYTYAPAYKRYGPKIHAVHFIGGNKPWKSIPTRPARAPVPSGSDLGFDYPSLVDRWFSIYDKYVRPVEGSTTGSEQFSVPENVAAWDKPALSTRQGRMDLEELKVAAERGLAATNAETGSYISLPLQGRIDLMRPKLAAAVKKEEDEEAAAAVAKAKESERDDSSSLGRPATYDPSSAWNAAVSAPPRVMGSQYGEMRGGMTENYENAWDRSDGGRNNKNDWASDRGYPTIPDSIKEDAWYAGAANVDPDRKKVKAVFPWESQRTNRASRVWPEGEGESPQRTPALHIQAPTPPDASQRSSPDDLPPASSPLKPTFNKHISFQDAMSSYTNAWDDFPAIQRYADQFGSPKKRGSMPPATPGPRPESSSTPTQESVRMHGGGHGRRSSDGLDTKSETSHDGDDEQTSSSEMEEDDPFSTAYRRNDRGGGGGGAGGAGAGAGAGSAGGNGSKGAGARQGGSRTNSSSTVGGNGNRTGGNGYGNGHSGSNRYKERSSQTDATEQKDHRMQAPSPVKSTFDHSISNPSSSSSPRYRPSNRSNPASASESSPPATPPYPNPVPKIKRSSQQQQSQGMGGMMMMPERRSSNETVTTLTTSSPGGGSGNNQREGEGEYELLTPPNEREGGRVDVVNGRRGQDQGQGKQQQGGGAGMMSLQAMVVTSDDGGNSTATTVTGEQPKRSQMNVGRVFDPSTSIDSRRRDTVEVLARFMRQAGGPAAR